MQVSFGTFDDLKTILLGEIDAGAENKRAEYITLGGGQALVYANKVAEAEAILRAEIVVATDFPLLNEQAISSGISLWELAMTVAMNDYVWQGRSAQIEVIRLDAKAAVRAATSAKEARTAAIVDRGVVQ